MSLHYQKFKEMKLIGLSWCSGWLMVFFWAPMVVQAQLTPEISTPEIFTPVQTNPVQTNPVQTNPEISKPETLITLDSEAGEQLLFQSNARRDYLPLSLEFVTQDNLAYCGVASLVMVLNALEIEAPNSPNHTIPGLVSYRFFTQENLFEREQTRAVKQPALIARQGMTLQELSGLFKSYSVDVDTYHGETVDLNTFRSLVIKNLKEPKNFIVVNYLRREMGQNGGGHISPIGAYDSGSDRFLILDVARYRYDPVWVKAETLWKAMNTVDASTGKTRGFLLINSQLQD